MTTKEKSPLFKAAARNVDNSPKTIHFDANRPPVKSVQANAGTDVLICLAFYDKNKKKIDSYNPDDYSIDGPIHKIAENEELIGVYGVKEDEDFSSFGFIVRVKHY